MLRARQICCPSAPLTCSLPTVFESRRVRRGVVTSGRLVYHTNACTGRREPSFFIVCFSLSYYRLYRAKRAVGCVEIFQRLSATRGRETGAGCQTRWERGRRLHYQRSPLALSSTPIRLPSFRCVSATGRSFAVSMTSSAQVIVWRSDLRNPGAGTNRGRSPSDYK